MPLGAGTIGAPRACRQIELSGPLEDEPPTDVGSDHLELVQALGIDLHRVGGVHGEIRALAGLDGPRLVFDAERTSATTE
jgi:hypothetical protein